MFRYKKIKTEVRKRLDEKILGILTVSESDNRVKNGHILVTERHVVYIDENKLMAIHHYDIHSFALECENRDNKTIRTLYIKTSKPYTWYVTERIFPYEKAKKIFFILSNLRYYD